MNLPETLASLQDLTAALRLGRVGRHSVKAIGRDPQGRIATLAESSRTTPDDELTEGRRTIVALASEPMRRAEREMFLCAVLDYIGAESFYVGAASRERIAPLGERIFERLREAGIAWAAPV